MMQEVLFSLHILNKSHLLKTNQICNCSPPSSWSAAQRIGMTPWLPAMSCPKTELAPYDMQIIAQQKERVNLGPV